MKHKKIVRWLIALATASFIFFAPNSFDQADASNVVPATFQKTAANYLGVKYSYGGTSTKGFDCSGYVLTVMKNLGVSLPRTSKAMYNVGQAVNKEDLQPGDLVFFSASPGSTSITHVGMYYGDGKFIHSQNTYGVSVTSITDKWYWGSRYVGAKRVLN